MSTARSSALFATIAVVLAAGCGPKRVAQPTRPMPQTVIVLLPDPESGTTGRAHVTTMSDADVKRLFGAAFAALPPAPRHFTLQFRFESNALTEESIALVPEILRTVKVLLVPEVVVIGHSDTMGDRAANLALGLKRAISVRDILVKAGLARSTIEATSHGEADLLVKTPDNTPEPRNRRVEITVR
jgi:outer membrane protein OmpA-like peptidoglycan-associated protein